MRTLVITPTFQEAANIDEVLRRARAALPSADILVVDDNSPDGTADLAERVAADLGQIHVLRRPTKDGLGNAYRVGFTWGLEHGYEILVQMDADLSHDPGELPVLVGLIEDGADLAIGSRYVPGGSIPHWPLHRRALSRYGNRYATFALGVPVSDATAGFRAYRGDMLKALDPGSTRAEGYGIQIELAYKAYLWGAVIRETPIVFTDRVRGHSKMSWPIAVEEMRLVTWWGLRDRVRRRRRGTGR